MKDESEIEAALNNVDEHKNEYPGMTYEQGVREALDWVLGDITDEEFEYAEKG